MNARPPLAGTRPAYPRSLEAPLPPPPQGRGDQQYYRYPPGGGPTLNSSNLIQRAVRSVVVVYFIYACYLAVFKNNFVGVVCGTLVIGCGILPAIYWINGKAKGFPIMPLFSATYCYAYGAQFLNNRQILDSTPQSQLIYSCFVLCLFLLISFYVWLALVKRTQPAPARARMLGAGPRSVRIMLVLFGAYTAYEVLSAADWIDFLGSLRTTVMMGIYGFGALSTFALCYMMGEKKLPRQSKWLFVGLFILAVMASASSLLLIHSLTLWFLSVAGYIMGARRVPWLGLLIILPVFLMLQYGKYGMRAERWGSQDEERITVLRPWEYPTFYARWLTMAWSYSTDKAVAKEKRFGLLERSSLLQMFLLLQDLAPRYFPYMHGETYGVVISGMLPRFFFPNKISPLESTKLIGIHFGLQTREETDSTSIGWGLFNEAYANFGLAGTMGFGVAIALFFGWVTRFTMGYPILSTRGLFAVIAMNNAFQSEFTMATFAACITQATMALTALSFFAMRNLPVPKDEVLETMSLEKFVQRVAPKPLARRLIAKSRAKR